MSRRALGFIPGESDFGLTSGHGNPGRGVLLYRTRTIKAGDFLECEMYPVVAQERGARAHRQQPTREAQKAVNLRNAQKRLERLMNANFGPGDLLPHLTLAKPCDEEEMQRLVRNFLTRLRRLAKKRGSALKYIYVIEGTGQGDNRKWHAHMVVNGDFCSRDELEAMWSHGLARVDRCKPQEKGLCGYAQYITQRKETQEKLLKRRWACSKGLKQPIVTVSDHKFSRLAARKIAEAAEMDSRAEFERRYPGYRLAEPPRVRYSDWLPGAFVSGFMKRERTDQTQQASAAAGEATPCGTARRLRKAARARANKLNTDTGARPRADRSRAGIGTNQRGPIFSRAFLCRHVYANKEKSDRDKPDRGGDAIH